jgi:hypothetical protein
VRADNAHVATPANRFAALLDEVPTLTGWRTTAEKLTR